MVCRHIDNAASGPCVAWLLQVDGAADTKLDETLSTRRAQIGFAGGCMKSDELLAIAAGERCNMGAGGAAPRLTTAAFAAE
jgi:hypothetical protein